MPFRPRGRIFRRNDVLSVLHLQERNDVLSFAAERCPGGCHLVLQVISSSPFSAATSLAGQHVDIARRTRQRPFWRPLVMARGLE